MSTDFSAEPHPLLADLPLILGEVADGVTVQNSAGRLVFANPAAAKLGGFDSPAAMLMAPPATFTERFRAFDESGAPLSLDDLPGRRALRGEPGSEATLRFVNLDSGTERWSVVRALPILEADGRIHAVINIFKDVTLEMQTREALRESESRFRALAETVPVLVWMAGTDGLCNFFNRGWLEFTGRTPEEEEGEGWAEGVHPDDLVRCLGVYRAAFAAREPFRMEYRLRRFDGDFRWILDEGVPRFLPDGSFAGYIGSCVDVSEHRRTAERMQLLLDATTVLGQTLDYRVRLRELARFTIGRLADWCAVDILGDDGSLERLEVAHRDPERVRWAYELQRRYPASESSPRGLWAVLRTGQPDLIPEITDEMIRAVAQDAEHLEMLRQVGFSSAMIIPLRVGERTLGALTLVTTDSGRRYGESDLELATELGGRASTAIENARLFSAAEAAREALEAQTTELEEIAAEMQLSQEELLQRTQEAEKANRAKADFLAMMSHELRTPLNAISGYADILLLEVHGPLTETQREDLRRIQRSQEHLLGIINDVLSFARLESGRVGFDVEEVGVEAVLGAIGELVEPQLVARRLEYRYRAGDPRVRVRADIERMRQVMLNLLTNAIKFTPPGGTVRLEWEAGESQVAIRLHDTGRGIPPDRLQAVFEPFVQLDATLTREVSGVGLGLAISRDLARAMGGDLHVESAVGVGSTFVLKLPLARQGAPPAATLPGRQDRVSVPGIHDAGRNV